MEKALSQEERLRRAEEIYYRRKNAINSPRTATVSISPKKNYKLLKKVIIQIIICVGIYSVIYELQSNTDSFSIDSINYLKGAMSYDIDINKAFEEVKKYMLSLDFVNKAITPKENDINQNLESDDTQISSGAQDATLSASKKIIEIRTKIKEQEAKDNVPQSDEEYIKSNFSLIKPVEGTVTSRFGLRNPTTPTVPKNHTGIDIGVPEGTIFIASMEGTVEVVSSVGAYRKSCKNNKWRCIYSLRTL